MISQYMLYDNSVILKSQFERNTLVIQKIC